jgi:IS1 family transposase/transposase-like protein
MTCPKCQHETIKKFGTTGKAKIQRYRCKDCSATFSPRPASPLNGHTTSLEAASRALAMMLEGVSLRAVSRLTGIHKNTLMRLMLTAGLKSKFLFNARMQNINTRFVQADELWTFAGKKQRRVSLNDARKGIGDQWLWIALDSDTKAVLSFHVGKRTAASADALIRDLRSRVVNRFQLTTDGFEGYTPAVAAHFGEDIDFAQLVKNYAKPDTSGPDWWRPSKVVSTKQEPVIGTPDFDYISTSHVERFNLNVRMHLRRFTRLTNAFSKSVVHLQAAVALFIAWYNFCRVHQTLRVTPAMEAGLTDHVWSVLELLTATVDEQKAA